MSETFSSVGLASVSRLALVIAVRSSSKTREIIATEAQVHVRSMRRWLNGESIPPVDDWTRVICACGFSPITCMLIASGGSIMGIRQSSAQYIDRFLTSFTEIATEVEHQAEIALDPRAAKHDANLVRKSWADVHKRRQRLLDDLYLF